VQELREKDILDLVTDKAPESINLDYKRDLPGKSDGNKRELLADVSSFANKLGGIIIYGIEEVRGTKGEHTGIPRKIFGLENLSEDVTLRIESTILSGLAPKLANCVLKQIGVKRKKVLVLGIPRSLNAPHMISFEKSGKFFIRTNSSKDQMNVQQIREVFLEMNEWQKAAHEFVRERASLTTISEFMPIDRNRPTLLIHAIPLGTNRTPIFLKDHQELFKILKVPNTQKQPKYRFNSDGYLAYESGNPCKSLIQFFRNGGIEIYDTTWLAPVVSDDKGSIAFQFENVVFGRRVEQYLLSYVNQCIKTLLSCGVEPPLGIFVTILNVNNLSLHFDPFRCLREEDEMENKSFKRSVIKLMPVIIDTNDFNISSLMDSLLDEFWQSGGYPESPFKGSRQDYISTL